MKTDKKIIIGQTIFLKPIGNAARGNNGSRIFEVTITKIGNKFFNAEGEYITERDRFYIDTLMHDGGQYSPNYQGYISKQAILDEQERAVLLSTMSSQIGSAGHSTLTLQQCRLINSILTNKEVSTSMGHTLVLAVEFGYKQCEKGNNLEKALSNFQNLNK